MSSIRCLILVLAVLVPCTFAWTRHYCSRNDASASVSGSSTTVTFTSGECTNGLPSGSCVAFLRRAASCSNDEDWYATTNPARVTWWTGSSCTGLSVAAEYFCGTPPPGIHMYWCSFPGYSPGQSSFTRTFVGSECTRYPEGDTGTLPSGTCVFGGQAFSQSGRDENFRVLGPNEASGPGMQWACTASCGGTNLGASYICYDSGSTYSGQSIHQCAASDQSAISGTNGQQRLQLWSSSHCTNGLPNGDCAAFLRAGREAGEDEEWSVWGPGESIYSYGYAPGGTGPGMTWRNVAASSSLFDIRADYLCLNLDSCSDGTPNDPTTPLPSPELKSVAITNNNYEVTFNISKRYSRVQVIFEEGDNKCNFDSSDAPTSTANGWSTNDNTAEPNCFYDYQLSKSAQTVIATGGNGCGFTRDNTAFPGYATYRKTITVVTNQTRTISHAQSLRNQTYYEIKYTSFQLLVRVPTTVTASATNTQVFSNITVLQAVTNIDVTVGDPYKVGFTILTSSQAPYKLTYSSFSTTSALGTSVTHTPPDCDDTDPSTKCVQSHVFSDLSIVTTCPTKDELNDAFTMTFTVGCKDLFTGNCVTPSPASIDISFTLVSIKYCPQVEQIILSGNLLTYRSQSLTDPNPWSSSEQTANYVVGSTLYGQLTLDVGEDAATFDTTRITKISTTGDGGATIVLYDATGPTLNVGKSTGAALDAKVTAGDAFYMGGTHNVVGNSLDFTGGSEVWNMYFRMPVAAANTYTAGDTVTVITKLDFTAQTTDNDLIYCMYDGSNAMCLEVLDNNGGTVRQRVGTISGNTFTSTDFTDLVNFINVAPLTITMTVTATGMTIDITNGAAASTSIESVTSTFDLTNQLQLAIGGNEGNEIFRINSISVAKLISPEPVEGVAVEDGDSTFSGSVDWALDNKQARFSIYLENGKTVVLNPITDVEQAVTVSVVADVTYTTSSINKHRSNFLSAFHRHQDRIRSPRLLSSGSQLRQQNAVFNVGGAASQGNGNSAPTSSGSAAGMSTTVIAVAAVGVMALIVLAAYFAGFRAPAGKDDDTSVPLETIRSSSTAELSVQE